MMESREQVKRKLETTPDHLFLKTFGLVALDVLLDIRDVLKERLKAD